MGRFLRRSVHIGQHTDSVKLFSSSVCTLLQKDVVFISSHGWPAEQNYRKFRNYVFRITRQLSLLMYRALYFATAFAFVYLHLCLFVTVFFWCYHWLENKYLYNSLFRSEIPTHRNDTDQQPQNIRELKKYRPHQRRSEGGAGGAGRTRRHLLGGGKLAKI